MKNLKWKMENLPGSVHHVFGLYTFMTMGLLSFGQGPARPQPLPIPNPGYPVKYKTPLKG